MRRDPEAAERIAARRRREEAASPIRDEVPELERLSIEVQESSAGASEPQVRYIRHVVVDRARAVFDFPCYHRRCRHGGHDVTRSIMRQLRQGRTHFEGRHNCAGTLGEDPCPFELHFVALAEYR